ncbi:MAG: zinc-binding dehydrogenase [Gaiellaceae bacterium MAG52_C11]|nr:zinc-binding dehydrogenase [Candidatus Gaiellasilicea maunaloa]
MPVPEPGHGQLLVRLGASSICGSDIRAIYREHLGVGAEAYRGVIAGHEPCGRVVAVGPGCRRFGEGDRVLLYHIAGCGRCADCRAGYMVSCTSSARAAYGWQRDGGHADYVLAEESTCIALPDELSFVDGACVACGFGTAYEAVSRAGVSGCDAVLVTGIGPVGLAVGMLAKALGSPLVIAVDLAPERLELALRLGCVDEALPAEEDALARVRELTGGDGCDVAVDCSGSADGRRLGIEAARRWGRCVLVGEGGRFDVTASPQLIHNQLTVIGSWVTSIGRMEELTRQLVRWRLHPETTVTDRFPLAEAVAAYALADEGRRGKISLVMDA